MALLIAALCVWMVLCAYCGFRRRFVGFLAVLISGLVLNTAWMVAGLDARPFELHAVIAHAAATLYALCAFAVGLFAGRIRRAWRDSRVEREVR